MGIWAFDDERVRDVQDKTRQFGRKRPRLRADEDYCVESLEQRLMLAISPTLTAIIPNDGDVVLNGQTRHIARTN